MKDGVSDETCVIQVERGGNCFFRCVAKQLFEDFSRHQEIRSAVVDYMESNADSFSQLVDGDFKQHIQQMRNIDGDKRSWATEAEFTATAQLYNIDVYVKHDAVGHCNWLCFRPM